MAEIQALYGNLNYFAKQESVETKAGSKIKQTESPFVSLLEAAATAIRQGACEQARTLLKTVAAENVENPEYYNLFGISYEKEGDRLKASKFYRVAYYMDQSFGPASENLDRVCQFWYKGVVNVAWGLVTGGVIK